MVPRRIDKVESRSRAGLNGAGRSDELPGPEIYEAEPAPFDFGPLVAGTFRRPRPSLGHRADGQALFYRGKEHTIYGETECGKDMLLVSLVQECLEREVKGKASPLRVAWIDFEEGDGSDCGMRLLNLGLDPSVLMSRRLFRYYTPADSWQAQADFADALAFRPSVAIFNGVTAAYGLFGWTVKDNDSATAFRAELVRPMLSVRAATFATDHVTKEEASSRNGRGRHAPRGRYAIGGGMKLNVVTGSSLLMENVESISRGGDGASRLFLTKDRPGSVKPACARTGDPPMPFSSAWSAGVAW